MPLLLCDATQLISIYYDTIEKDRPNAIQPSRCLYIEVIIPTISHVLESLQLDINFENFIQTKE